MGGKVPVGRNSQRGSSQSLRAALAFLNIASSASRSPAASSPEMWRDIALANRAALLDDLDAYRARLDALRSWIAAGDRDALDAMFRKASAARSDWEEPR